MDIYKQITSYLNSSSRILFITGAGISVDSGIRSYRGVNGKWTEDKKIDGIPISEIMTGMMIRSRPKLTWKCLADSEKIFRQAKFNRAH